MKGERPRMIAGICARLQPGTNSTGQECAAHADPRPSDLTQVEEGEDE
jgi:hypothetical protein